ncbi:Putative esterase [Gimesia panareensis]|uniref:Esterase n=1 Tax=Gimesia panareensis TaxID=2527978 RepID=A0A517Q3R5_9PLAN|nr:alpha/beta hydrolase-fold protein [Gimesia panareensis]QDT26260.1 Putative esterase [Gimesia panareensis]
METRKFVRMLVVWGLVMSGSFTVAAGSAAGLETEELFPRVEAVSFESANLKKRKRAVIVLPENWRSIKPAERRTLVILHGRGRHERSLVDDKMIRQQLLESGLFVILPDGDDGWYLNSPVRQQDVYETYLEEVLAQVANAYDLPEQGQQWAIAGWSMGGFGCVRFAERHPGRFAAVSSIIGLLDFPRNGLPTGQSYKVPVERFGADEVEWNKFNPLNQAGKLRGASLLIITADQAFDRTMNEHFRDRLTALELPHQYVELKGGHTFPVVRAALPLVLAHTQRVLLRKTRN